MARAQYRFDSWTTDNGLPQASVNSIIQTRDGFLWFATFGGLVRYDGLRFQVFNTGNTKGLRTGRFISLFEDRDGNLWANTEGQGLTRYKDEVFTTYTTAEGLPSNQVGQISADASGNVLIEVGGELVQWKSGTFAPYTPSPDEPVNGSPQLTPDGAIWYRDGPTLRKVESGRVTATLKADSDVRIFYEDRSGRVWIGTRDDRLFVYEAGKLKEYSEAEGYAKIHPTTIGEDRQGSLWFGTNGQGLFQLKDGRFTRYTTQDGLVGDSLRYVYEDRGGMRKPYRKSFESCSNMKAPPPILLGPRAPTAIGTRLALCVPTAMLSSHSNSPQSGKCASASALALSCVRPSARASSYAASRCSANSSTISASRGPSKPSGASRKRTSRTHSAFAPSGSSRLSRDARDAVERREKLLPCVALRGQHLLTRGRQSVVAAAALARLLNPPPLYPPAPLHAVEQRVERGRVELEHALRTVADEFRDFVAVARPILHERHDEHLGAPLLQFAV